MMLRTILLVVVSLPVQAAADDALLHQGFNEMYNLSFAEAHRSFETWAKRQPGDARGPVFDASAYLFSEFDRLRILQSQFFVNDNDFEHRQEQSPDPAAKRNFDAALAKSRALAEAELRVAPHDEGALLATVLRLGLQADYDALIDKQNLRALREMKEGRQYAEDLLSRYPKCYDAYLAVGVENYLLSLKPLTMRWLLHATGAQTDKGQGIANLKLTAAHGEYLQPYAELLLAVAALRDKNNTEAKRLLSDLAARFPHNRLYREELKKIS